MAFHSEKLLVDVVHDLRQPLATIEYSAYFLQMLLGESNPRVVEQILVIKRQVEDASRVLAEAAAALRRGDDQRAGAASLALTNAVTAVGA